MMAYVVGTSVADDGKAPVVSVEVFLDAYSAWAWWQELMRSDGLKVAAPIPRDSPFAYGNPTATALYATRGLVTYFLIPTTLIEERT